MEEQLWRVEITSQFDKEGNITGEITTTSLAVQGDHARTWYEMEGATKVWIVFADSAGEAMNLVEYWGWYGPPED